jgi:hypothetical protein
MNYRRESNPSDTTCLGRCESAGLSAHTRGLDYWLIPTKGATPTIYLAQNIGQLTSNRLD